MGLETRKRGLEAGMAERRSEVEMQLELMQVGGEGVGAPPACWAMAGLAWAHGTCSLAGDHACVGALHSDDVCSESSNDVCPGGATAERGAAAAGRGAPPHPGAEQPQAGGGEAAAQARDAAAQGARPGR